MALPPDIEILRADLQKEANLAFRVVSGSMEPVIMTGDMIQVEPLNFDDLRVFDILLFWDGKDKLICHYLWHINSLPERDGSSLVVTRPLAGEGEDLPTPREHLMGRIVSHRIPFWTRVSILAKLLWRRLRGGILSD